MTESEIKGMLKDIINGAEYEYTYRDANGDYKPWMKYVLGNEINPHYVYRKMEKWYVYGEMGMEPFFSKEERNSGTILFSGSKESCEKWIEEHTKKTWLEEYLENDYFEFNSEMYIAKTSIKEVCEKILEEVREYCESTDELVGTDELYNIIKGLGVEV